MCNDAIEFDTLLDLCRHVRRRVVLGVFIDRSESTTVTALAEAVVEHDCDASATPRTGRTNATIALSHRHLPKLDSAGLLEYDSTNHLVTPTSTFDRWKPQIGAIVEADPELETPIDL
ncbi:DUF7344 domain-containing protein [Natronobacterium gregoryi]|uniref:DUF7344 domain-containing protein n=2 Tax=Natronobacterium gregoryi TaxID=44930 RepID=L0AJ80_NATGS|nr:hypothetical protein [Natronobacterium gregoryi]AFZ73222.1 hypothetical protein Natgr_2039 [Natronobacterium gregoryi SP2]ELY71320.1 hypothetical protein C490_05297 [Natronobacterium gregoryi SP2]PLK21630.1 hypothetical protein CYV19_03460 [Natronobacterium gregoryi SP2]SFI58084.1 hypothetical protein SAMN05443661_10242 [Natronobacterium gregoryi]